MKSLIVLLIISSIISSSLCTLVQFGVATAITANTASSFTFDPLGLFQLSLTVDSNTMFTLTPYFSANYSSAIQADGAASISNGFNINADTGFTFGGSVAAGVKLSFSSGANILSGSVTIPGTFVFVGTAYGLLEWSFTASAYAYVAPTSITLNSITVPIIGTGILLSINYNSNNFIRLPTLFSQNRNISSNSMSYSYPNGIFIDVSSTSANSFNVTFSSSNSQPPPTHHTSQNKFIDINAASSASVNANISFSYTSSQNPNSFSIAFFDETSSTWTFPSSGLTIDTTNQLIVQSSNHFSTWALYTSSSSTSSSASCIIIAWSVLISAFVLLY